MCSDCPPVRPGRSDLASLLGTLLGTLPGTLPTLPPLVSLVAVTACGETQVLPPPGQQAPDGGAQTDAADDARWSVPTVEAGTGASPPDAQDGLGPVCAEQSHLAERVPLDLLLLLDRSRSMNQVLVGESRKWDLARQAFVDFIRAPASAPVGLGLQFFPNVTATLACTQNGECASAGGGGIRQPDKACVGPSVAPGNLVACDGPGLAPCPAGSACRSRGVCAHSTRNCFDIGSACPGGLPDDTCLPRPRTCGTPMSCKAADYQNVVVPISSLADRATALMDWLRFTDTFGSTPMEAAVEGGLTYLRAHLSANPGRKAALVLATDGLPSECGVGLSYVEKLLGDARTGTPAIASFVVGVLGADDGEGGRRGIGALATAGGAAPFIVNEDGQLTQKLLEALNQIRTTALPCEFAIPPATGALDYGKVNLRVRSENNVEDVLYVGRADRCDPTRGGWYVRRRSRRSSPHPGGGVRGHLPSLQGSQPRVRRPDGGLQDPHD